MPSKLKVGDRLLFITKHGRDTHITISSVGRKWARCSERKRYRINVETLYVVEGHYDAGRCVINEASYREDLALSGEWIDLLRCIKNRPTHVTRADIAAIKAILERPAND